MSTPVRSAQESYMQYQLSAQCQPARRCRDSSAAIITCPLRSRSLHMLPCCGDRLLSARHRPQSCRCRLRLCAVAARCQPLRLAAERAPLLPARLRPLPTAPRRCWLRRAAEHHTPPPTADCRLPPTAGCLPLLAAAHCWLPHTCRLRCPMTRASLLAKQCPAVSQRLTAVCRSLPAAHPRDARVTAGRNVRPERSPAAAARPPPARRRRRLPGQTPRCSAPAPRACGGEAREWNTRVGG